MNQLNYSIIGQQQPVTTLGEHIGQAMKIANDLEAGRQQRETYQMKKSAYQKELSDDEKVRNIWDKHYDPNTGMVDLQAAAPEIFKVLPPDKAYPLLKDAMAHHDALDQQKRSDIAQQGIEQQKIDQQIFNENKQISGETGNGKSVSPELAADNTRIAEIAAMTPMEQAQNYGLIEGSAYNPGAKSLVDAIEPAKQQGMAGVFMAKLAEVQKRFPKMTPQEQYWAASTPGSFYGLTPEAIKKAGEKSFATGQSGVLGKNTPAAVGAAAQGDAVSGIAKVFSMKAANAAEAGAAMRKLYNPVTKQFDAKIDPQIVEELSIAIAKLVAPGGGQPAEGTIKELTQSTLSGDLSRMAGYLGIRSASKSWGTTPENLMRIAETIDRLGKKADQMYQVALSGKVSKYESIIPEEKGTNTPDIPEYVTDPVTGRLVRKK